MAVSIFFIHGFVDLIRMFDKAFGVAAVNHKLFVSKLFIKTEPGRASLRENPF